MTIILYDDNDTDKIIINNVLNERLILYYVKDLCSKTCAIRLMQQDLLSRHLLLVLMQNRLISVIYKYVYQLNKSSLLLYSFLSGSSDRFSQASNARNPAFNECLMKAAV